MALQWQLLTCMLDLLQSSRCGSCIRCCVVMIHALENKLQLCPLQTIHASYASAAGK